MVAKCARQSSLVLSHLQIRWINMECIKDEKLTAKISHLLSQLPPEASTEEIFSHLWSMEEAHKTLSPKVIYSKKSEIEAERHRVEGNNSFQKRDFNKALACYNLSIMAAPHPPYQPRKSGKSKSEDENPESLTEDMQKCHISSNTQYRTLALAFANRSAVLFEISQYDKCLSDIDLALSYGYPEEKRIKIVLRKAKCFLALKEAQKAKEVLETNLEGLPFANSVESNTNRKMLRDLLKRCQSQNISEFGLQRDHSKETTENLDLMFRYAYQRPPLPKIKDVDPSIPTLSSSVKMIYSHLKGRILLAIKDIYPGEVVVVEESFCWTLQNAELNTNCSCCFMKTVTPLPCPSCSKVIFCSETCLQEELQGNHGRECDFILPTLLALPGDGKNAWLLLFRMITSISFAKLKRLMPQLQQESKDLAQGLRGFNENGIYDSKDYRTVYHLMNYRNTFDEEDMQRCCKTSFILTKILQQTQWYFMEDGYQLSPSDEDLVLIGSTILHHSFAWNNLFPIREYQIHTERYESIGFAIHPVMSMCSHSCNPSVGRFNNGKCGILRSLKYIDILDEITIEYNTHFLDDDLDKRRRKLCSQYDFNCTCEACKNKWPKLPKLPREIKFKCVICYQPYEEEWKCYNCPDKIAKEKNILRILKLKQMLNILKLEMVPSGIEENPRRLKVACDIIEFMDRYTYLPSYDYFLVQNEIIKELWRMGFPKCV